MQKWYSPSAPSSSLLSDSTFFILPLRLFEELTFIGSLEADKKVQ
jgi:hypothetical protein